MRLMCVGLCIFLAGCASFHASRGVEKAILAGPEGFLERAVLGPQGDGTYIVASGQRVDPAGNTLAFDERALDLAVSPDGTTLAVKTAHDLRLIDIQSQRTRQILKIEKDGASFTGVAWSRDGTEVWLTGGEDTLHGASLGEDGDFAWTSKILLPGPEGDDESAPGGIALDNDGVHAYVALSRNNSIGVVNLGTGEVEHEIPVGIAPYGILKSGSRAYVTNWGGRRPEEGELTGPTSGSRVLIDPETGIASSGTVSVLDLPTRRVIREIAVDLHPSGMTLSPDGTRLYVANANSDTVSVIDTNMLGVVKTLSTKPMDTLPFGSAPNAVAVSPNGKTLYVANGGNNAVAVIDIDTGRLLGLIPTGWYPGAVVLADGGSMLCIANTKGIGERDVGRRDRRRSKRENSYDIGINTHDYTGSLTFVKAPSRRDLDAYTVRVATNMRIPTMHEVMDMESVEERVVPVPRYPGEISAIKHILYIIKENRTYDQVLGDLPRGNGDPALCQFGREVTPNHHALAEQFVLLDNFYCNGVLSADGHQWTNEGYVTDYIEKSFGNFSRSYPYDGDDALAFASSGFIWDYVLRAGLSLRVYGEFVKADITPCDATWTDIYTDYLNDTKTVEIRASAHVHTLEPYICPTFIGFPGKVQDVYRAREFIRELEAFEQKGELPNFMIMLLPNNHTMGTREGYPTPRAAVADNDLALGQIVEAVTHSKFWPETAIFVVEDDPQAGLDHVDGHRTVAMCISPYTKRESVDSHHYNQTGMLRTMELILGLPPMNQLDMASDPMYDCFQETPDYTPYLALPNNIPLDEMNPIIEATRGKQRYYAKKSMEMPLDDIDQADEDLFNRIIWHSVKGYDTPYPVLARRPQLGGRAWGTKARGEDLDD